MIEKPNRKVYILPDKYHKGIHSTTVAKNKINSDMIAEEN